MRKFFTPALAAVSTLLAVVLTASGAHATILTFDIDGIANNDPIPQQYGDRVASTTDSVGSYLEGNGFTPNVTVDYLADLGATPATPAFWDSGYGHLVNVMWGNGDNNDNNLVGFRLVADPGYAVALRSVLMAGWVDDWTATTLSVFVDGALYVDFAPATINGDPSNPLAYTAVNTGAEGSIIEFVWGNAWGIAIDDVNFDQTAIQTPPSTNVPEPATLALLLLGLAGLSSRKQMSGKHNKIR